MAKWSHLNMPLPESINTRKGNWTIISVNHPEYILFSVLSSGHKTKITQKSSDKNRKLHRYYLPLTIADIDGRCPLSGRMLPAVSSPLSSSSLSSQASGRVSTIFT